MRTLEKHGIFNDREHSPCKAIEDILVKSRTSEENISSIEKIRELATLGEVFIKAISSPSLCSSADLELLVETIKNVSRLRKEDFDHKSGDSAALKVKELLIRIMMPSIKDLVIPKWLFDSLEKRLVDMRERLRHKELELERIKRMLKDRGLSPNTLRLYIVTGLLEETPTIQSGETAKLICPWCNEINLVSLPLIEIIEEAQKKHWIFRAHCQYCSKIIDVEPHRLLSMLELKRRDLNIANKIISNPST